MKQFTPFEPVLVRNKPGDFWNADFFNRFDPKTLLYKTTGGKAVTEENILSYNDDTKHVHNTVLEFDEWKPKKGDVILVRDNVDDEWQVAVFDDKIKEKYVCVQCGYIHKQYGKFYDIDENETEKWKYAKPYVNPFKSIENNLTK